MPAPEKASPSNAASADSAPPPAATSTEPKAITRPLAVILFLALAGLSLAADLWTKHAVFESLLGDPQLRATADLYAAMYPQAGADAALNCYHRRVAPGVAFTLRLNPNIAFGLPMFRWLVPVATAATILFVAYFFAVSPARARWTHAALALVLGGALGNLYDRVLGQVVVPGFEPIRGHVRDFVDCSEIYWKWTFNLADAWLVIGVGILILAWWKMGRKAKAKAQS